MGIIQDSAEWWANDNKRFEEQNPSLLSRVGRVINPLTGFGQAMGDVHTRSGQGDLAGSALAGLSGVPVFGAMKLVQTPGIGAVKAGVKEASNLAALFKALIGSSVVGGASDAYGRIEK